MPVGRQGIRAIIPIAIGMPLGKVQVFIIDFHLSHEIRIAIIIPLGKA
jgi:hypothetical protein